MKGQKSTVRFKIPNLEKNVTFLLYIESKIFIQV